MSYGALGRQVNRYLQLNKSFLFENFVLQAYEMCTTCKPKNDAGTFNNFDYARYAADVTFQHTNRSSEHTAKGKNYVAEKRKLYGYNVKLLVLAISI